MFAWFCRYDNEQPFRKAVEDEINSLYKVIDDANLTRADLENQIESMKNELMDLENNHTEVRQEAQAVK